MLLRNYIGLFAAASAALLAGCNQFCFGSFCFGGSPPPPVDFPGTFSSYEQEAFTNEDAFCLNSNDSNCTFGVNGSLDTPLVQNGWNLHNDITDGYVSGSWTTAETTESQFISDNSNLVYISSHGGISGNQSIICLRDCNGSATGGTIAIG